jgi:glycosyltransferase involved in cell wall biosynthesis
MPLPRTLFVARGSGAVGWYRCAVPAMALGVEWIGVVGEPPNLSVSTGMTIGATCFEDFFDYDVLILQQPLGRAWISAIRRLQEAGVTVLFEVDDYVQAIRKMQDHDFAGSFPKEKAQEYELSMRVCDGVIVSTEYLARRYRAFNKNVFVCRNGLDLKRYALTLPERDHVNVGWAGGTGHREAMRPWLPAVAEVLRERPATSFVTIGQGFAAELEPEFGPRRARSLPFAELYTYPAAMTSFDVALAPAGRNNFFRGKSDLRWLEASALGIPIIADPDVYPDIEHGVTGFHAADPSAVAELLRTLVDDPELRARVGAAARAHVREHRSAQAMSGQWANAIATAAGERVADVA